MSGGNLPVWIGAVGTLLLAAIAALQDIIRSWFRRPRLEITADAAPPACHKTTCNAVVGGQSRAFPCYYFRLKVENTGNREARLAEVVAARLQQRRVDGRLEDVSRFAPMNLLWSHVRKPFYEPISPGMFKFLDLGFTFRPEDQSNFGHRLDGVPPGQSLLAFDLEVKPNTLGYLAERGRYELEMIAGAANARPKRYRLEINFLGMWHDDGSRMLRDGFGMRLL